MHDGVRIDKWLWAARFYKTRTLATQAVVGGKVHLNGERAKPARHVMPGDSLRIRSGPYEHVITVRGLAQRRGSAQSAAALYEEAPESVRAREVRVMQVRLQAVPLYTGRGRPTKKARRTLDRVRDEQ